MKPLHYYLIGTGSWFGAFGMQSVLFAWLVTIVLHESAERVGLAQMALLLPGTLFILIGGSMADRYGGRRVAVIAQLMAALAPFYLLIALSLDALSFTVMLGYAVILGTAQAFVTPSRDGLLNQVAAGRVQRTVMLTSLAQFGTQIVGALCASFADVGGPMPILVAQTVAMLIGAVALSRVTTAAPTSPPPRQSIFNSVREGAGAVLRSPSLRIIVLQNVAMALCFMGSFIVILPLIVREVYAGSATDLSFVNAVNAAGLVVTILLVLRLGGIKAQGRSLILSQIVGCLMLALAATMQTFASFVAVIFVWGVCGGVAMTMSRTIMQEQAPAAMRGRVMSFYGFSFMGAGPVGALMCGYLAELFGPQRALLFAAGLMLLVVIIVALRSGLWRVRSTEYAHEAG